MVWKVQREGIERLNGMEGKGREGKGFQFVPHNPQGKHYSVRLLSTSLQCKLKIKQKYKSFSEIRKTNNGNFNKQTILLKKFKNALFNIFNASKFRTILTDNSDNLLKFVKNLLKIKTNDNIERTALTFYIIFCSGILCTINATPAGVGVQHRISTISN